ncbi:MAG: MgtC/SapB family protein [Dehalococcoidia bacterium]|nr:MgtC/SapB family protein [Dehalococcoidia bacterium]
MSNADQLELVARLLLALALGAAIGLEREFRGHQAGIRTSALVCFGAAAFAEVSGTLGDSRVAAGVVQGIGFLGAGLIFQSRQGVSGVTTAATVWVIASVGLLVASDLWLAALLATGAVIVLLELSPVSDWVYRHGRVHRGEPVHETQERDPRGAPGRE